MLKLIIIFASLFFVGYLIVNDYWTITVTGFGYEVTVSTVLLLVVGILLAYLVHVIKKPFRVLGRFRGRRTLSQQNKRETYFFDIIKTVLEDSPAQRHLLFKQAGQFVDKKTYRYDLIEALLKPNKAVFEKLTQQSETQLAGLHGLYEEQSRKGNMKEMGHILDKALVHHADVPWVIQAKFNLLLQESDWENAAHYLEILKKNNLISKEEYQKGYAGLLYKNNKIKAAYEADKSNPTFAIAYARENPAKAADILYTSWQLTPCWETYCHYMDVYKDETPTKQMKALKRLTAKNPTSRLSLLIAVDTSIRLELWRDAKETMEVYMQTYPLTKQAADLMATIVRKGWHHEEEAREWEQKTVETDDKHGWTCSHCHQETYGWDMLCPHCNQFGTVIYNR